ncbi:MAG: hypothetical protein HYR72_08445 [Deltaproteobacteria bacterium]|nr:hypothetical protein [Deltaproteobacteria bacterium]MBI3388782.1 hypothetical protein [Deltaproteobacteria bacterium]
MVSTKERDHFRLIQQAEEELNQDAIRACARRSPEENIVLGLALSEFAASFGADRRRPDEVAPIQLWRNRYHNKSKGP